jgi:hypothetical protein
MRPNLPSQIAQRLAAPFQGYWELLRIVASWGPSVGSNWCSPLVRHRTSRIHAERLRGRNGLPGHAVYRDIVSRALLSCAASQDEAASCLTTRKVACQWDRHVIEPRGRAAVAFNLFDRGRGHAVTCNRLFRLTVRLRGSRPASQSYVGKRAI